ncbi:MAG: hypothetical protein WC477_01000 [Patescibacteria group bacterium]
MQKKLFTIIGLFAIALMPMAPVFADSPDLTAGFDPNAVLTDNDIFSLSDSMSHDSLVNFLRSKGALADIQVMDIDGTEHSAADVIWEFANMYQINPKYLLATLQKEQSLVEDPAPSQRQLDWAMGFGVCDSCSKDDPAIQNYKGFANQMYYAARQMREKYYISILINGTTISGMGPGITKIIDGIPVTPVNAATASVYSYTPHIHGNLNLWTIWRRWFTKNFPDGSLVQGTPSKTMYWIRFGERRPFASIAAAQSLTNLDNLMTVSDSELAAYPLGATIQFPNYSLLKDPSGKIWLLVENERRQIINMDTFHALGFIDDEIENVKDADLASYDIGDKITSANVYPTGELVQAPNTKAVWYVEVGVKHLIENGTILTMYFRGQRPKKVAQATIDQLETGDPYRMKDGELVKSNDSPAVFVIEHGDKRLIPSGDIFESLGWKWSSITSVPSNFLATYSDGDPVGNAPPVIADATDTSSTATAALQK